MGRKAKSETKKQQEASIIKDELMILAVSMYLESQEKVPEERKSLRGVCTEVEELHRKLTGDTVKLNHETLRSRAKGGRSIREANAAKSHLYPEEAEMVIENALELAARGFPLSPRRLREHANEILQARLGSEFPEGGVGVQWPYRFIEKHDDRLRMTWSRSLHTNRGRAVNPVTNEEYFDLLGSTIGRYDIEQDCTWATDETGIQPESGEKERVIGKAGEKTQYQQRGGSKENMTVIVTICADGTSIAPAVVFKGKGYSTSWKQDNPLNAS